MSVSEESSTVEAASFPPQTCLRIQSLASSCLMTWLMNSFGREIELQSCAAFYLSSAMRLQLSRLVSFPCTRPHEYPVMFGNAAVGLTVGICGPGMTTRLNRDNTFPNITAHISIFYLGRKKAAGAKTSALTNCLRQLSAICLLP